MSLNHVLTVHLQGYRATATRALFRSVVLSVVAVAVFGTTTASVAADPARDIIQRTGAFYQRQTDLTVDLEVRLILPPEFAGMGEIPPLKAVVSRAAGERLAVVPVDNPMDGPTRQDGTQFYSELPMMKSYVLREAVPLADLVDGPEANLIMMPGLNFVLGLGLNMSRPGSLRRITGTELLTEEEIDGVQCHHLSLTGSGLAGEIWIATGDEPWVVRFLPASVENAAQPDQPEQEGMVMFQPDFDIRLSNWRTEPVPAETFSIAPPASYKKLDRMPTPEEMMAAAGGPGGQGAEGPHPSIGQPAPAVSLKSMDGGVVELADLKGKVVLLDFWATWCKPCVMALPLVTKVAGELADQGVVFYAVNQREETKTITPFLRNKGLATPVALDEKGEIGAAFGVGGIPHSVLIDKTGTIRNVHVGFGPGMDQMLKQEIIELLAE